jgi:DNA mismatch endonuclease, patch repair protein
MSDVFTPAKRSAVMASIRSKGNRDTELRMIALLRAHRIRGWRRGSALFGKPDFVFPVERVALFVDGCFWHGCPRPKHAPMPRNRAEWWAEKLGKNKTRDQVVSRRLQQKGWTVVRVWECDLTVKRSPTVARRIARVLNLRLNGC